jgi:T5SS/PEP-CTERM-associated repeat protein
MGRVPVTAICQSFGVFKSVTLRVDRLVGGIGGHMRLSFAFKRLTVVSVTLSAWLVTPALAGTKNWVNPFGGMFGDARNWSPSPPTVSDDAVFDVDGDFAVHFTTDVTTQTLRVGSSDVTLDLAGFGYTLSSTVADALHIGLAPGDVGVAYVAEGAMTFKNARIGATGGSIGTLVVNGTQAIVTSTGMINVGYFGSGQMTVSAGAQVHSTNTVVGLTSAGNAIVTGAESQWINTGSYFIGGPDAVIDTVSVLAGGVVISQTIEVQVSGQIAGDSVFQANVNSQGKTAPGGANHAAILTVQGNYTQGNHSQATTLIELGGTEPGEEYDVLHVTGAASIDKTLSVSLLDGYSPSPGAMFDVIVADSVTGAFSIVNLPSPNGGAFSVQYLADRVRLIAPGQATPGDVSGEGTVNVVDLLAVINNWGNCPGGATCSGDLNHDSQVNVTDLLLVINNWG